jgi:hypothetical protein
LQDRVAALETLLHSAPAADSGSGEDAAIAASAAEVAQGKLENARQALARKAEAEEVAAALRQEADALAR